MEERFRLIANSAPPLWIEEQLNQTGKGMNTAYISSNLYRQIRQNDDNEGIIDDRSSLQVANTFLHLHPPSINDDAPTIGTPLRLISKDNIDSDIEEVVYLHPLMLRVLSRLSPHRYQEDNTYDVIESNRYTVLLSSWDSDGLSTDCIDGSVVGWLEHINIISEDKIKELNDCIHDNMGGTESTYMEDSVIIHISYICSNCSRGREFFSSKGTELLGKEGCIDTLMDFLYGSTVVEGGILGMDISNTQEEEVVFFMVNKIVTMKDESNVRFLYLRHDVNFNIIVDHMPGAPTTRPIQQPKIHEDVYCPGYYSVLEELVTLAKMSNPDGAPSAVILSGCAGVGKSRMVCCIYFLLLQSYVPVGFNSNSLMFR